MSEPSQANRLRVEMRHSIGTMQIDVNFAISKPWTILFGPSGSGKTTILRAIAGLLRPNQGKIVSSNEQGQMETLVDTDAGVWVPAHERRMPLVPQRLSLFPHLTVAENIRYGIEGGVSPTTLFETGHLAQKLPLELSGGEAQRVSLARAAMPRMSRALLLDEPFTGLDLPLRDVLIGNLLAWQKTHRVPILSVTHDIAEAFLIDAEVIKLSEGHVVEQGPTASVLAKERERLLEQLSPAE